MLVAVNFLPSMRAWPGGHAEGAERHRARVPMLAHPSMRAWPGGHAEGSSQEGSLISENATISERFESRVQKEASDGDGNLPKSPLTCVRALPGVLPST